MSRPASNRLEIVAVDNPRAERRLRGAFLGVPQAGDETEPRDLLLRGWVLGEKQPALTIEVLHADAVIARVPVDHPRPDVEEAHPDLAHAGRCGFESRLELAAVREETDLELRAVLSPISRVPFARLKVRPRLDDEAEAVSVIIPCFKQAHFLSEAIESVLAQSHPRLELIVVDDGSPDNTGEVAARYPGVSYLRQDNQGLAAARNSGLAQAGGDYVLFLDADDRLLPEAIELGLAELRRQSAAMMAAGTWRLIGEEGEPIPADPPQLPEEAYPGLLESCFISTPAAVLYRRALFDEIGAFDPSVAASADYDLYLRTAARFPVRLHGHAVAEYRRHGANMTRNPALIMEAELAVLGRQRPLVAGDARLEAALERGVTRSRDYHGARLAALAEGSA